MQPMGLRFSDEALPVAYDRLFTASSPRKEVRWRYTS
jgi:hypothetical protein